MNFDFGELLAHVEDGERSLATIPATIWTGRIPHDVGTDIDELNLARCIAIDRDFPAPDSRAPMLVVLTDRRLLIGQAKRGLRRESGLRRVLGEVPLDHIERIEPTKVGKGSRSVKSYNRLGLVCLGLLWVLTQGADAVDNDSSLLENTPAWLPTLVLDGLFTLVCLVGLFAFIAGAVGKYVEECFVVEANLSNGKSILLQLYGDPDSFLSAFGSVSDRHRSAS